MLKVNPVSSSVNNQSFKGFDSEDVPRYSDISNWTEDTYGDEKSFWNEQKDTFDYLRSEEAMPKPLRKPMKFFSVIISGVLGAMAMAWASKRSIDAMRKFKNSKKLTHFIDKTKNFNNKYWNKFKNLEFVKNIADSKFAKSKFVQEIQKGYKNLKSHINNTVKTIKTKLKADDCEKAAVNVFGVAGGVTSAVNTIKANNNSPNQKRNNEDLNKYGVEIVCYQE